MMPLAFSAVPVAWLQALLWDSCYGAIMAGAVFALQPLLRPMLAARWRFALWLLVMIRFLPLSLPATSLSLFNWLPHNSANAPVAIGATPEASSVKRSAQKVGVAPELATPIAAARPAPRTIQTAPVRAPTAVTVVPAPFDGAALFACIYFLGAGAVLVRLTLAMLALRHIGRRCAPITKAETLAILEEVRGTLGIRRRLPLFSTEALSSPALVGLWRPRLFLPAHLAARLSAQELRLVFLHEAAHLRRRDIAINYVVACLGVLHWFNPFFWLTLRPLCRERELACDELVLRHTSDAASYGHTLLKLFQDSRTAAHGRASPLALGIIDNKTFFTRRIHMIAAFKKRPAWLAVPAVFTLLAVGVCTLTSAQTPVIRAPNRDMPAAPLLPVVTAAATSPEEAARVATKMAALQQQQAVVQAQLDAMSNIGPAFATKRNLAEQQQRLAAEISDLQTAQPAADHAEVPAATSAIPVMAPPRAGDILSFDATIYEVRISPDQISRLDVDALTKVAGTAESFEKALAALGDMRPLYRANESGSFNEEHYVKIGIAPPEAAATKPAAGRGPLPPGATGATFDYIPKAGGGGTIELDIAIQATVMLDAAPAGTTTANPPKVRSSEVQQHRTVAPQKPFLLVDADASTLDAKGKAVVLITRINFGPPHNPAAEPVK